ncbi:MAG: helix-turn-helix transcriptional regulator [Thermoguttaceae bacterium]
MSDQVTVSAAGMRIVRMLVGKPPQTVADLIKATGVTRTAVTEQLNELAAAGYLDRTVERLSGRGRPRHLYSATDAALMLLFASNQRLVMPAIWQAINTACDRRTIDRIILEVSRSLAAHYRAKVTAKRPEARLKQMMELLQHEGVLLQVVEGEDGGLVVHKRSCPFSCVYEETGSVCCVDLQMMKDVVGVNVVQTACRHKGAPCCSFAIASTNGRSS